MKDPSDDPLHHEQKERDYIYVYHGVLIKSHKSKLGHTEIQGFIMINSVTRRVTRKLKQIQIVHFYWLLKYQVLTQHL